MVAKRKYDWPEIKKKYIAWCNQKEGTLQDFAIALGVGYSSLSHFAKAWKDESLQLNAEAHAIAQTASEQTAKNFNHISLQPVKRKLADQALGKLEQHLESSDSAESLKAAGIILREVATEHEDESPLKVVSIETLQARLALLAPDMFQKTPQAVVVAEATQEPAKAELEKPDDIAVNG